MFRLYVVLSLVLLSACGESEVRKDYLNSRVMPPLKLPADVDQRLLAGHDRVQGVSAEELAQIDPAALIKPPGIIDEISASQADATTAPRLQVDLKRDDNGVSYLFIKADYDLVWREIRLSLVATGFTLTDVNRSDGLFYIRYRDPDDEREEYVIQLIRSAGGSRVLIRSVEGTILATEAASRILTILKANL
ncbi:MAG: outer membrane protein assembly factor BamC [Gammaproteobacteria bacterium]|nr:outer membrane protein assembly factor BamC [Gammaproteobacteria bacterium]